MAIRTSVRAKQVADENAVDLHPGQVDVGDGDVAHVDIPEIHARKIDVLEQRIP